MRCTRASGRNPAGEERPIEKLLSRASATFNSSTSTRGRTSPVASVRPPPRIPTHMVGGVGVPSAGRGGLSLSNWPGTTPIYCVLVTLVPLTLVTLSSPLTNPNFFLTFRASPLFSSRLPAPWDGLPYFRKAYPVDAHRDCGGSHTRECVILIAVALGP